MDRLEPALAEARLRVAGVVPVLPGDPVPDGARTLLLLSPVEPGFWAFANAQPEFSDGGSNPLDRMSRRLIVPIAGNCNATAHFPFAGPPYLPFIEWAQRSGRIFTSPIGFLVSREAGLFVSFRGALAVRGDCISPPAVDTPCNDCSEQPCTAACPVDAFASGVYDAMGCRSHLEHPEGIPCLTQGCRARRACPFSANANRSADQSAFHMKAFLQ